MAIGIVSAVYRNRWPDRVGMTLAVSGISFPAFALGMVLMQMFSVQLGWLPTVGDDTWRHYILPSITLGAAVAAIMARFTRSSFVDILGEDYIRTARAKGLDERRVVIKHGLRNALIPVVTMMGLQFGFLLGGSIVVEKVFNWPGLGPPAGRRGRHARLPGDPGAGAAVLARVHPDQPDRRRAVRPHQPDDPLPMTWIAQRGARRHRAVAGAAARSGRATSTETVRTPWSEFWRKFKQQKVALVAGGFVLLLVVVAILGAVDRAVRRGELLRLRQAQRAAVAGSTGSASMRSAATSSAAS